METIPQHRGNHAELSLVYGHVKTTSWASIVAYSKGPSSSLSARLDLPVAGTHTGYSRRMSTMMSPDTNYGPQPPMSRTSYLTDENLRASIPVIDASRLQSSLTPLRYVFPDGRSLADNPALADNPSSLENPSSTDDLPSPSSNIRANPDTSPFLPNIASAFQTAPSPAQGAPGAPGNMATKPKRNQTVFIKRIRSCKAIPYQRWTAMFTMFTNRAHTPKEGNGNDSGNPTGTPTASSDQFQRTDNNSVPSRQHGLAGTHEEEALCVKEDVEVCVCSYPGQMSKMNWPFLGLSI
jgi:hypothetical protein